MQPLKLDDELFGLYGPHILVCQESENEETGVLSGIAKVALLFEKTLEDLRRKRKRGNEKLGNAKKQKV